LIPLFKLISTFSQMQFDVMVGVSTQQNTANAIPAVQLNVQQFLLLETDFAVARGWSKGLQKVLKNRGLQELPVLRLDKTTSSRIDLIKSLVLSQLEGMSSVLFNLGGGQKAQQLALWEAFTARNNPNDRAVYANPNTKKMEIWARSQESLVLENHPLNSSLSVLEILEIFGQVVDDFEEAPNDYGGQLYDVYNKTLLKELLHGMHQQRIEEKPKRIPEKLAILQFLGANFDLFARLSFAYIGAADPDKRKTKLKELVNRVLILAADSSLAETMFFPNAAKDLEIFHKAYSSQGFSQLPGFAKWLATDLFPAVLKVFSDSNEADLATFTVPDQYHRLPKGQHSLHSFGKALGVAQAGFLFEEVVWDYLKYRSGGLLDSFVDVKKNLKISKMIDGDKVGAEHDVIMATKNGTLISLDAKLSGITTKDLEARLLNFGKASGTYATFALVVPLDDSLDLHQQHNRLKVIEQNAAEVPIIGLGFTGKQRIYADQNGQPIKIHPFKEFLSAQC